MSQVEVEREGVDRAARRILEISRLLESARLADWQQIADELKLQCYRNGVELAREYLILKTQVKP